MSTSHTQSHSAVSQNNWDISDAAMMILKFSGDDKDTDVKDASKEVGYFLSVTEGKKQCF